MSKTESELLLGLVECFRNEGERTPEDVFWAWNELTEMVRRQPAEGLRILVKLVHAVADSRKALAKVGAGPLEDLLVFNGTTYLADVIAAANRDVAMKKTLLMVWPDQFDEDVRRVFEEWVRDNGGDRL